MWLTADCPSTNVQDRTLVNGYDQAVLTSDTQNNDSMVQHVAMLDDTPCGDGNVGPGGLTCGYSDPGSSGCCGVNSGCIDAELCPQAQ